MPKIEKLIIGLVALVMATSGFWVANYFSSKSEPVRVEKPKAPPSDLTGLPAPDFKLGSLSGAIFTPENFSGQVVLYNFWATWCAPCIKEMPMLQDFHQAYLEQGFSVVGIALDDVQAVRQFTTKLGITYPILVGADDVMKVNRDFGNTTGSLPFSVLVDNQGIVRWQEWGIIEEKELNHRLASLLKQAD